MACQWFSCWNRQTGLSREGVVCPQPLSDWWAALVFVCVWLPYLVHGRLLWGSFLHSIHEFCPANSSQFGLSYSDCMDCDSSGYGLLISAASFCLPPAYPLVTTRTYYLVSQIIKRKYSWKISAVGHLCSSFKVSPWQEFLLRRSPFCHCPWSSLRSLGVGKKTSKRNWPLLPRPVPAYLLSYTHADGSMCSVISVNESLHMPGCI